MKNNIFLFLIITIFVGFFTRVQSQEKDSVVVIEHADSLVGTEINGESARQLIGNVKLRHGSTVVTCDRAIQYLSANKFEMEGVVEIKDDTMRLVGMRGNYYAKEKVGEMFERVLLEDPNTHLQASYGKYFAEEKKAYFKGNVYVEDTASILTANELTYFRSVEKSIADGNVKINNRRNRLTIFGTHFENDKKNQYSKMTGNPRLIQIDTTSKGETDTLIVTASTLESYQDSVERLIATDSVQITRGTVSGEAGLMVYFTEADSIFMTRAPCIWYETGKNEDNQITGESIFLKLKKRKLETAYVRGRAVAISRADTIYTERFNQMTGQEIILRFVDDKVNRINVITTATSLYYLFDNRKPNGMNVTTGDEIIVLFKEGKIDKIKALSGVEGKYYPEKMIKGKETDYNLPEFNWKRK
jgi:lipopolysaccharide export system protein LptA